VALVAEPAIVFPKSVLDPPNLFLVGFLATATNQLTRTPWATLNIASGNMQSINAHAAIVALLFVFIDEPIRKLVAVADPLVGLPSDRDGGYARFFLISISSWGWHRCVREACLIETSVCARHVCARRQQPLGVERFKLKGDAAESWTQA
jgi:hypothetical protein